MGWFTGVPEPHAARPGTKTDRHVVIISDSAFAGMRWSGALKVCGVPRSICWNRAGAW
jgi:hypothetical protein